MSERVVLMRARFSQLQPHFPSEKLVFIDESGFRLDTPPRYGWSRLGQKCYGKASAASWKNITLLGAIALDGFRGFMTIEASTTKEVFRAFILEQVVPRLKKEEIVILDNLKSHSDKQALQAILDKGASYIFLPPYSPDLNPIEKLWGKVKDKARRLANKTATELDLAIAVAMNAISKSDTIGWFKHAGYLINAN